MKRRMSHQTTFLPPRRSLVCRKGPDGCEGLFLTHPARDFSCHSVQKCLQIWCDVITLKNHQCVPRRWWGPAYEISNFHTLKRWKAWINQMFVALSNSIHWIWVIWVKVSRESFFSERGCFLVLVNR